MPLSLITEEFRVLGTQPDGDSVRFYPADPQAWATTRLRARVNPTPPAVSGSVLTRLADTHGRPVALAYAGTPADTGITAADLGAVQVDVSLLRRSVNQGLLADGLVYPDVLRQAPRGPARRTRLFTVPDGHATTLDTMIEVTGQTVRLTLPPEQSCSPRSRSLALQTVGVIQGVIKGPRRLPSGDDGGGVGTTGLGGPRAGDAVGARCGGGGVAGPAGRAAGRIFGWGEGDPGGAAVG